jgi:HlyD family secretion protein
VKRLLKPLIILAIILALAVPIGFRVNQSLHKPPPPPRTVLVHVGDIALEVTETGSIEPVDKVDVKSKAAGRLLAIPIQEGQFVQKGQLIALVDRSLIDPQLTRDQAQLQQAQARLSQTQAEYALQVKQTAAAIDQAKAALVTAQAHLGSVAAGARPQELAQQREAVDRARITYADALRTQKRREGLLGKGFISQADYDSSQVAVDTADSSLATAKQALLLMQAGPRVQDVADAQAQVAAARVQLASARANSGQDAVKASDIVQARASVAQISGDIAQLAVNIADTRIVAPASGIVLKKYKEPNEIVQSATTGFSDAQALVATLGSRLEVKVGINEVDIAKVGASSPATIQVDALPGVVFSGRVSEIAPASTNAFDASASGGANAIAKFSVKVGFARYDARLRSGMSATVTLLCAARKHAVLLPLSAVPFAGSEGDVRVYRVSGPPRTKHIILGLRTATEAEVRHGLFPGQSVLIGEGK